MAIINYHDLDELKNVNEEKVWEAVEAYLNENTSACRCRDCVLDAAALALNNLPPRYQVYAFHSNNPEDQDDDAGVIEAVAEAFRQVIKKPHHF